MTLRSADTASGVFLGHRKLQQDTVDIFGHAATGLRLLCLSDGIGGAGHGNLASRLVVRSAMANLRANLGNIIAGSRMDDVLLSAAQAANRALASSIARRTELAGMGGTLLLAAVLGRKVHYLSIGDSLIFRLRGDAVTRLNALHSLAGSTGNLVATGQLSHEAAESAALRSTLTSALTGQGLQKVDLPANGVETKAGDILMLASDGIETLSDAEISTALQIARKDGAAKAASAMLERVACRTTSGQDNVSVIIARI